MEADPPAPADPPPTTIGPEPATEVTPALSEAMTLAPTDDAVDADADADAAAEAEAEEFRPAVVEAIAEEVELLDDPGAGQVRSYSGVVVRVEPIRPKLGLGVLGAASCRVYQKVLILPRTEQATSSQNCFAF